MPDPNPVAVPPANATAAAVQPKPVQATPAPAPAPAAAPAAPAKPADQTAPGMVPLPALQEERSRRQALEAELAQLRQQSAQPQYQQQPQQMAQPQYDVRAELDKLWENDPKKAVQTEILYAMEWRDHVDAGLNSQADQLASKYPDFNNFRSAAMNQVRSLPLNQRSNPGILEAAYWMTRGQNVDQLLQQRESELMDKYRRGEITAAQLSQPAGMFTAPAPMGGVTLTVDQIKVAEAMGLTPEGYASQIKLTGGA